ncbi:MAG TPA: cytochrome c oxidase subunit II [Planctomycetota bacterium]|nr:cytochrome c oxidase subunit II [Planctomycetota bacterium]
MTPLQTDSGLLPEQASTIAGTVDAVALGLVVISAFFTLLISVLIVVFAVKYRRRPGREIGTPTRQNLALELAWTAVPLLIVLGIFVWGASVYYAQARPPDGALEIFVVGKQWMWKFQHPEGPREINELHVPVGRPIRLTMTSEDVIHSFFVPAFRVKWDVVPGRYTGTWFEATKVGEYHLFCAEYCGTNHALMRGRIVVLDPADYGRWLAGGGGEEPPPVLGRRVAERHGCLSCHVPGGSERGGDLAGLFGREVRLADGTSVVADETYLRESIVRPSAKLAAGWPAIMPSYQGQIGEEDLLRLVAWIRTLRREP